MVMRARVLALLGAAVWLSACNGGNGVGTTSMQEDVLPATESSNARLRKQPERASGDTQTHIAIKSDAI